MECLQALSTPSPASPQPEAKELLGKFDELPSFRDFCNVTISGKARRIYAQLAQYILDCKVFIESVQPQWRSIESAPEDGTDFLVWCTFFENKFPPVVVAGKFGDDGFYCQDGGELSYNWNPIYWQPLPASPNSVQKQGAE